MSEPNSVASTQGSPKGITGMSLKGKEEMQEVSIGIVINFIDY